MIEIHKPKALVLGAPGINRDEATATAYRLAGAEAEIVPISALERRLIDIRQFQIFSVPGGFSYGDHIESGSVLASKLSQPIVADQLGVYLDRGGLMLGVCNGFQAIVNAGLLPFGKIQSLAEHVATLDVNIPAEFISNWVYLNPLESNCPFVPLGEPLKFTVAHGEGRFLMGSETQLDELFAYGQVSYQYSTAAGDIVSEYPYNPNGSVREIAAICDPSGQILGMMPHAEDFVIAKNDPNWRRKKFDFRGNIKNNLPPDGLRFFQNLVSYAAQM